MIHAAIFEQDARVATILKEILAEANAISPTEIATTWNEVRKTVALHMRSVVVMDPETSEADLQHAFKTTRDYPGTGFVYVVDHVDTETLRKAMRHGIRDVVAVTDVETELAAAVVRAHALVESELGPRISPADKSKGKVVAIFGPKGGTGKTMLATNLAVLSAKSGIRTVLVDGAIKFGDCAAVLRIRPEHTFGDLAGVTGTPDDALLDSILTSHDSGLKVLCAPNDPVMSDNLDADIVTHTLEGLRNNFDLTIVDTGPSLDSQTISVLALSDLAYLVTSLELPAVKNAKLSLSLVDRLHLGAEKIRVVVNRANSKVGFPLEEVPRALGRRAASELPSDIAVPRSMNTGMPVTLESPRARVSRAITGLAEQMRHELFGSQQEGKRRSLLRSAKPRTAEL